MQNRVSLLATIAVALSALLWGLWWMPLRALSERGLPTDWTSLLIYALGSGVLLLAGLWRGLRWREINGLVVAVGAFTGLMLAAWNHALITGEVVRVTLLFYLAPIWGTLLGFLALGLRVTGLRVAAIILGLAGAAVVLGFEDGWPVPRGEGEWMGLASGVVFAFGATCAHHLKGGLELEKTLLTFVFAALASGAMIVLLPHGSPWPQAVDPSAFPLALAITVGLLIPITLLLLWGAGRLDPGRVSILYIFEVLAAAVSASLLTDEPFTWREAAGALLIVAAGVIEGADQMRKRPGRAGAPATEP